jgi:hypothetical protein
MPSDNSKNGIKIKKSTQNPKTFRGQYDFSSNLKVKKTSGTLFMKRNS